MSRCKRSPSAAGFTRVASASIGFFFVVSGLSVSGCDRKKTIDVNLNIKMCFPEGGALCEAGSMFRCKKDEAVLAAMCQGDKGCIEEDQKVRCDQTKGSIGDKCEGEWRLSCSLNGVELLVCKDDHFALFATCQGEKGCVVQGEHASCEGGGRAKTGAPCPGPGAECGSDGTSMLECVDHTFVVKKTCLGPKGCYSSSDRGIECDPFVANAASARSAAPARPIETAP